MTKILTGRNWNDDDRFEFVLAADPKNPDGAVLPAETTKYATKDSQTVTFGDIVFNKYGTFKFTITETEGDLKGVGYDTEPREFTIVVSDDGIGSLYIADVTNAGKITVSNPYESEGQIQFFANKELVGRKLKDGEFLFELQDAALNSNYQRILRIYADDPAFIAKLKASQRAWLKFRDAEMEALFPHAGKPGYYGSSYEQARRHWMGKLTEERTMQLARWLVGAEADDPFAGSIKRKPVE